MASTQLRTAAAAPAKSGLAAAERIQHVRERFEWAIHILERVADLAAVVAGALLAHTAYQLLHVGRQAHYSFSIVLMTAGIFAAVFVFLLDRNGGYERANSLLRIRETERILRVSVHAFALVFAVSFLAGTLFSRWLFVFAAVSVPLLLIAEKQLLYQLIRHLHTRGYGVQKVLIYGAGQTGRRLFSSLARSPKLGLDPVAIVDDNNALAGQEVYEYGYTRERSAQVVSGPLTSELIRECGASLVLVGIPSMPRQKLREVAGQAFAAQAQVAFVPQLAHGSDALTDYVDLDGVLLASFATPPPRFVYEMAKRTMDIVCSLALIVITLPVWAMIAMLIRRDSPGPVFFKQKRVGRDGAHFELWKFRSMNVQAPKYDYHPTAADDPRVTRMGRWLRRTSLDELPQVINVLKGEMSLVGPRPEMPFIVEQYDDRHRQRLKVIPGLTGLWQLSADRSFLIHENIHYDLYYIRHRNFYMDLAILLHTVVFAMRGV